MASSSPSPILVNIVCYHCKSLTERFFFGWKLHNGSFAMLCENCSAALDDGTFCETFHHAASGWRECVTCNKRIHCGCIVSAKTFVLLDVGGVQCRECDEKESPAPTLSSPKPQTTDSPPKPTMT